MNQIGSWVHKPTDELLVGVSAVEEHGQLGLLGQLKLLLKVSVSEQSGENEECIRTKDISGLRCLLHTKQFAE